MTRFFTIALLVLLACGCAGGKGNAANEPAKAKDVSKAYPPGEQGAKDLAAEFVAPKADTMKLLTQLKAAREDLEKIYRSQFVDKAVKAEDKLWGLIVADGGIRVLPEQTEVIVYSANTRQLAAWSDKTRSEFSEDRVQKPFNFRDAAQYLLEDLTVYRFKFVKPGQKSGAVFNTLLVHANGRWSLICNPGEVIGRFDEIMAGK